MNTTTDKPSRRHFLANASGAASGLLMLSSARTAFSYRANERLNLAVVGMSGFGAYHGFAAGIHNYDNAGYALSCDVDLRKIQRVYKLWKERAAKWPHSDKESERKAAKDHYLSLAENHPPLYRDFRRMLDEAADRIDAVVVATPDHTHAVIAAAALRAGKPVFAEKPLTISSHEARSLRRLALEAKLPTQMNTHGAAQPGFRRGVEIIRDGVIGDVEQVHIFAGRGGLNYQRPPLGVQDVPKELDWNLWLAQVRWREYHREWINRVGWRETSIGTLGNAAPHFANMAFMALNVKELWDAGTQARSPIQITAECSNVNNLSYPRWERICWRIPARSAQPPVALTWHRGFEQPDYSPTSRGIRDLPREYGTNQEELGMRLKAAPTLFVGSKGLMATNGKGGKLVLLPEKKFNHIEQKRPQTMPLSPGHYKEWVDACQGSSTKPISNSAYATPFAEFLTVGSLATRFPNETLEFDPVSGQITNHPRAAEFLQYEYRKGWTI